MAHLESRRARRFFAATLAVLAATLSSARAQSPECDRYRAELASLGPGGGGQSGPNSAEAQRARGELDRMRAYYAQIGCNRGGGFIFFNQPAPQECGSLSTRIRQMESNLSQLQREAENVGGGTESRRRQLQAAINQACRQGGSEVAGRQPPNFLEQLFGAPNTVRGTQGSIIDESQGGSGGPLGGSRVVCVRTCDGFFFPLPAGGREGATEMCQALCPEAETQVFFMSPSGDIERGVSATGQPYLSLANASRYKKAVVPNCGCRKDGEKWVDALQRAEDLLDRRKTDIVVTSQKAEEMSRPRADTPPKKADAKGKKAAPPAQVVAPQQAVEAESDAPIDQAAVPTAGKESAGIGPQTVGSDKILSQREGQIREVTDPDGKKRKVRVVAPNMFGAPQSQQPVKLQ